MDPASLRFALPSTPASLGLNGLLDSRAAVAERLLAAEHASRFASDAQIQAAEALSELERRAAGGQDVSAAERTKAERALSGARARAGEPWPERIRGLRSAMRDSDASVASFIGQHWAELAAELEADALEAAERVDRAMEEIINAYGARERISAHGTALLAAVEVPRPNAIPPSRVEGVIRAAEAVMMEGGETPPIARRRDVPQAVQA